MRNNDLTPGQKVYKVVKQGHGAKLVFVNFVHKNGSWYRYRNLTSGREWNENGFHWQRTKLDALQTYLVIWRLGAYKLDGTLDDDLIGGVAHDKEVVKLIELVKSYTWHDDDKIMEKRT